MARKHNVTQLFALMSLLLAGLSAAAPAECRECPKGSVMTAYCFDDPCNLENGEDTQRDPWACRCVFEKDDTKPNDDDQDENRLQPAQDKAEDASCPSCPMFYELNFWCQNDPCKLMVKNLDIPDNFQCKCRMQTPVLVAIILTASLLFITIVACVVYRIRASCCVDTAPAHGEEIDMKPIVVVGSVADQQLTETKEDGTSNSSAAANIYTYYATLSGGEEQHKNQQDEESTLAAKEVSLIESSSSTSSSSAQHSRHSSSLSVISSSSTIVVDSFDGEEEEAIPLRIHDDEEEEDSSSSPSSLQVNETDSPSYQPPMLDH